MVTTDSEIKLQPNGILYTEPMKLVSLHPMECKQNGSNKKHAFPGSRQQKVGIVTHILLAGCCRKRQRPPKVLAMEFPASPA